MTLPTLIQHHRSQVLKNQLKKAYSIMSQAVEFAKQESGLAKFRDYCILFDNSSRSYFNGLECSNLIMKQFKTTGKSCKYDRNKIFNYNKSKPNAHMDIGTTEKPGRLLADGMCVGVNVNAHQFGLSVDINGDKKGPNALGHDIFAFWINENDVLVPIKSTGYLDDENFQNSIDRCGTDDIYNSGCASGAAQNGYPCTINSNQNGNGIGCSWYAVNDKCPDDETKGYWECLPK